MFYKCHLNGDKIPKDWRLAYISSIHKEDVKLRVAKAHAPVCWFMVNIDQKFFIPIYFIYLLSSFKFIV